MREALSLTEQWLEAGRLNFNEHWSNFIVIEPTEQKFYGTVPQMLHYVFWYLGVFSDPENARAFNNKKYYIQMLAEQEVDTKGDTGEEVKVKAVVQRKLQLTMTAFIKTILTLSV